MLKKLIFIPLSYLAAIASAYAVPFAGVGNMDTVNSNGDGAFRGWVCASNNPNVVQKILIFRDGKYVGRTTTGVSRPDVPAAGYCSGNMYTGWSFVIPAGEFSGVNSSWSAAVEDATSTAANILEFTHPTFGGSSVYATLPKIARSDYISPTCFWADASYGGIVAKPGSIFDTLTSFWNYNTKINGSQPLDRVTTYDAGVYTGTYTAPYQYYFQRGDNRTNGFPVSEGRSALQRNCYSAGIMTNSFWLDNISGEKGGQHGVNWSFKDDIKLKIDPELKTAIQTYQSLSRINPSGPYRRPYASGSTSALVFEGDVQIPGIYTGGASETAANGQANFYVYLWDTKSGKQIAVVMGLWDSRPSQSYNPSCLAKIKNDTLTNYASQLRCYPNGPYATFDTSTTGTWTPGITFASAKKFRVTITASNLSNIINAAPANAGYSTDLHDYILTDAMFGTEINGLMSLGASISNFSVYVTR